jgi:hypothetical protein
LLYLDSDQQTNLATHKPTQEKIKHPTAQVAHLALPDTQADPSAKPKEPLFPYAPKTVEIAFI